MEQDTSGTKRDTGPWFYDRFFEEYGKSMKEKETKKVKLDPEIGYDYDAEDARGRL